MISNLANPDGSANETITRYLEERAKGKQIDLRKLKKERDDLIRRQMTGVYNNGNGAYHDHSSESCFIPPWFQVLFVILLTGEIVTVAFIH